MRQLETQVFLKLFYFFLYASYSRLLPAYSPIPFHLAVFRKRNMLSFALLEGPKEKEVTVLRCPIISVMRGDAYT